MTKTESRDCGAISAWRIVAFQRAGLAPKDDVTASPAVAAVQPIAPVLDNLPWPNDKPTSGPWHVLADPVWKGKHPMHDARFIATSTDVERDGDGWRFVDHNATIVCTMPDAENQKGNAQLIAAAPDLLAALLRFTSIDDWSDEAIVPRDVVKQAFAAIAKAKGVQS